MFSRHWRAQYIVLGFFTVLLIFWWIPKYLSYSLFSFINPHFFSSRRNDHQFAQYVGNGGQKVASSNFACSNSWKVNQEKPYDLGVQLKVYYHLNQPIAKKPKELVQVCKQILPSCLVQVLGKQIIRDQKIQREIQNILTCQSSWSIWQAPPAVLQ